MLQGETVLSGATTATTDDFEVICGSGGWFIGTQDEYGTVNTRETEYFESEKDAETALFVFQQTGYLMYQRT
jgi:hypothetical protein